MRLTELNVPRVSATLRKKVLYEVGVLFCATSLFLWLVPKNIILYSILALLFFIYVLGTAKFTYQQIWNSRQIKAGAGWFFVSAWTLPVAILLFVFGYLDGVELNLTRLLWVLLIYVFWALVQQTLFQFYFLGRLKVMLEGFPVWFLCGVNGVAYALVHLPDYDVVCVTVVAGCIWSYSYYRHGAILPLVMSHAVLAAGYYHNIRQQDLIAVWLGW